MSDVLRSELSERKDVCRPVVYYLSHCDSVLCVRVQAVGIMAQMFELIVDKRERHLLALFGDGGAQAETLELLQVPQNYRSIEGR